jgi:hypothetical protein
MNCTPPGFTHLREKNMPPKQTGSEAEKNEAMKALLKKSADMTMEIVKRMNYERVIREQQEAARRGGKVSKAGFIKALGAEAFRAAMEKPSVDSKKKI